MSTIDNFELPAQIIDVLTDVINSVSTASVLLYCKLHPEVTKGFRPNKINHKIMRQRLLAQLKGASPIDPAMMALLAQDGFNLEFVAVFSLEVLDAHFADFAGVFGEDNMLAAMLVDSRETVRDMAISYLRDEESSDIVLPDKVQAKANLAKGMAPVTQHLAEILNFETAHNQNNQESAVKPEHAPPKVKTKDVSIKTFKKMEKSLQSKIRVCQEEGAALTAQFDREKKRANDLDNLLLESAKQVEILRRQCDEKIESGVRHAMSAAVRKWLVAPLELDRVVSEIKQNQKSDTDVLSKVSSVLQTQADIDRNFGNRRYLEQRLADLEIAQIQMAEAARYSLNPLPELFGIQAEIDSEKNKIAQMLGDDLPDNPLQTKLTILLNQVAGHDDLRKISNLLNVLGEEKLLSDHDFASLMQQLDGCKARFYEKYRPHAMTPKELALEIIGGQGQQLILVDGYNVLFGFPEYFALLFAENGKPGDNARAKLLLALDYVFKETQCLVNVFFDAEAKGEVNFSACVKEIYSGGGNPSTPDRADQAIIDFLERRLPSDRKGTVVTDDRELQGRAQKLGAAIMPLAQFAPLLAAGQNQK